MDAAPSVVSLWASGYSADEGEGRTARTELAVTHWYPVYAFLRASGLGAELAAERTERALSRFIAEPPAEFVPLLRDQLLALAQAALFDEGAAEPLLGIDREWAAAHFTDEAPSSSPAETFGRCWTHALLEGALATLQAEYAATGQSDALAAMRPFLGYAGGAEADESYAQLAAALHVSEGAARKLVYDLRRRYRVLLHEAVSATVASEEQVAGELQSLLVALPPAATRVAPRSVLRRLQPEELLVRGMNSVQMSTAQGGLGWTPPTVAQAARLFPGYEVIALLGRGGMGAVYLARQESLDRLVAIKLLPLEISVDPTFADRFRREARALAKLNHPNIISVFDFGQSRENHLFFVMEFVDGQMLHDLIHRRDGAALSPPEALAILAQVCDALTYAHEQGVIHRDIKPANVIVDARGRAKVADFGLARLTDPASALQWGTTMTGAVMGTPDYMSPEQKRGLHVDARADLYALGVVLYEALCQETPQGAFELPSKRRGGLDPRLDGIITKALAPRPEERFQHAVEIKSALEAVRSTMTAVLVPVAAPSAPQALALANPKPKSKRLLFVGLTAGLLVLAALALIFGNPSKPAAAAARPATPAQPLPPAEAWMSAFAEPELRKNTEAAPGGLRVIKNWTVGFGPKLTHGAVRVRFTPREEVNASVVQWCQLGIRRAVGGPYQNAGLAGNLDAIIITDRDPADKIVSEKRFVVPPQHRPALGQPVEFQLRAVGTTLTVRLNGVEVARLESDHVVPGQMTIGALEGLLLESLDWVDLSKSPATPAPGNP